jgi:hypothetical protein
VRRFLTDTEVPCADVAEVFTDYHGDVPRPVVAALRAMCRHCPVLVTCRDYVLSVADDVAGFAAGMTPTERQRARQVAS